MSDWNAIFKALFPEQHTTQEGNYWWQELNTLYDLSHRQLPHTQNIDQHLKWWTERHEAWDKSYRSDRYALATVARCKRMITALVKAKLEGKT